MSLNDYNTAQTLSLVIAKKAQYVKIITGERAGSIGRIVEVKSKFFSQHDYRIKIEGRKEFWQSGATLELLENHNGETVFVKNTVIPTKVDFMGREITTGVVLLVPRTNSENSVEMVLGTVKRISPSGAIYVRPIKMGNEIVSSEDNVNDIRVGAPDRAMVMDRDTVQGIVMMKLSN